MIKAVINREPGRPLVLLGISAENVRRLRDNQPILFDGAEISLPGYEFSIVYGDTEQALVGELRAAGFDIPAALSSPETDG